MVLVVVFLPDVPDPAGFEPGFDAGLEPGFAPDDFGGEEDLLFVVKACASSA